jgi:hypothetical protein
VCPPSGERRTSACESRKRYEGVVGAGVMVVVAMVLLVAAKPIFG